MLFLTDHPENTRTLLPIGAAWQAVGADALTPADAQLWQRLGAGDALWQCDASASGSAEFGARTLLIDDAPDSQFDAVVQALHAGATLPDRLICLALAGTKFRGQRGRPWNAVRGNLHLTVHYRVRMPAALGESGLTMLPAVAAARTVAAISQGRLKPSIKWVNDVLVDGRKVAGVLTSTQVEGNELVNVVFGIGMNVRHRPTLPASRLALPAGALAEFHEPLGDALPLTFHTLLQYLDEALASLLSDGPGPLYEAYRAMAGFIGKPVKIWADDGGEGGDDGSAMPLAAGRVCELRPDLSLIIEGQPDPVRKGRMQLVEEMVDAN